MKKMSAFSLCVSLSILFISCNKIDWRPPTDCEVQQFGQPGGILYSGPSLGPYPYLFSKTFDRDGNVETIDAYLFSLGIDFNLKARFSLKGQTLYCLQRDNIADTFMIVQLNAKGRPVKAVETRSPAPSNPVVSAMQYDFTYNKNRLFSITAKNRFTSYSPDTCTYDNAGNLVNLGRTDNYEYDLTQKPKQQFYFDAENTGSFFYGLHFLEYLNFFPEITSPVNVRTKHRVGRSFNGTYFLNYDLVNHKFDAKGKLISYDYGYNFNKFTTPIIYNCNGGGNSAK